MQIIGVDTGGTFTRVVCATFACAFGSVISVDEVIRQITDTTEPVGATHGSPN